ncbi:protein PIGBOS1 [Bombina bombina]|uniref:protein PIGBOS1 n=1 Tax=Bombina bombina TaxID=8345 RepID=UPI00235A7457|nr:protein PIGBOS1 [Bombina bombina]XP_053575880.1 protein PIGBOS1 [Bombina bombina]XP_053575881.1 protein PIGBOS1 [Bombina bombina]
MFRRLSFTQLLIATVVGVSGGVYIYKPIFEQYRWDQKHLKTEVQAAKVLEEKNE